MRWKTHAHKCRAHRLEKRQRKLNKKRPEPLFFLFYYMYICMYGAFQNKVYQGKTTWWWQFPPLSYSMGETSLTWHRSSGGFFFFVVVPLKSFTSRGASMGTNRCIFMASPLWKSLSSLICASKVLLHAYAHLKGGDGGINFYGVSVAVARSPSNVRVPSKMLFTISSST